MAVWGHLGAILGPSWGHVGPSWGHLGEILGYLGLPWTILDHLGPSWGHLGAILEPSWVHLVPFWLHFGIPFGSKKQPQKKLNLKTIYDAVLGPILEPFWDKIWTYLAVMWDMCWESRRHFATRCFSLFFWHLGHRKTIEKPWFVDGFAISAKVVLATQISPKS